MLANTNVNKRLLTHLTQFWCKQQMKNGNILDFYSDYLITAFGQTTATGLAALLNGEASHDQIQRWLASEKQTSAKLWQIAKPHVRKIEGKMVS